MKTNILLVYGGNSVEHEISIITALQIIKNYRGNYNLIPCYLKEGNFYIIDKYDELNIYKKFSESKYKSQRINFVANSNKIKTRRKNFFFEAVFIVSHGKGCEDGTIASFFNILNIPVITQDIDFAVVGQNKLLSKKLTNIDSISFFEINKMMFDNNLDEIIKKAYELKYPLIAKPVHLGSSVGVNVIYNSDELVDKIKTLLNLDTSILIERCLENFTEINIAILKYKNEIIFSEIEKVSNSKVLSYSDKYLNEEKSMNGQSKELPAKLPKSLKKEIYEKAKQIYNDLNASLIARIDFLYDNIEKKLYFNEINNIPGSLAFYLFNKKGITTSELIDMYLNEGLYQIDYKKSLITTYEQNVFKGNTLDNVKFCK